MSSLAGGAPIACHPMCSASVSSCRMVRLLCCLTPEFVSLDDKERRMRRSKGLQFGMLTMMIDGMNSRTF